MFKYESQRDTLMFLDRKMNYVYVDKDDIDILIFMMDRQMNYVYVDKDDIDIWMLIIINHKAIFRCMCRKMAYIDVSNIDTRTMILDDNLYRCLQDDHPFLYKICVARLLLDIYSHEVFFSDVLFGSKYWLFCVNALLKFSHMLY